MAFRYILNELLATTSGALAAIFLDWEGETVELVCDRDLSDHDLRIIGAYQAVVYSRLKEMCIRLNVGPPERYKVDFTNTKVLSCDLKDGYYVVLLLETDANEGMAWRRLARCRERMLQEI